MSNQDRLWVLGKTGWYMAKWVWDNSYAEHLRSLGFEVVQSATDPGKKS
jgi:hypothetical protein